MILRHAVYGFTLCVVVALAAARGAEPTIEFTGVLTADGKTKLALTDKATAITQWMEAGAEFKGYAITRYDPKEDAVFVKKGGQEIRLALASPKSSAPSGSAPIVASTAPTSAAATAAANSVRANLRQLATLARQYQQEKGVSSVSISDLVGPDKVIKELPPIAGENYSTLSFGPNVTGVSVTMADGNVVSFDIPPANLAATSQAQVGAPSTALAVAPRPATPSPPPTLPPVPNATTIAAAPAASNAVASGTDFPAAPAGATTTDALAPTGRDAPTPGYEVQAGDTWQRISQATGVPVEELRRLNSVPNGSSPRTGQTIRIR